MKNFLKKRWHGIPIGIIAMLALVGIVAAGSYTFLSGTIDIKVEEAVTVQYDWPGDGLGWLDWDGSSLTITGAYPGESVNIGIKICNASSAALDVNMVATLTGHPSGGSGKLTVSGGPAGSIAGNSCWEGVVTGTIAGDTPPGDYSVTLNFNRS